MTQSDVAFEAPANVYPIEDQTGGALCWDHPILSLSQKWRAPPEFPFLRRQDVQMLALAAEGLNDKAIARCIDMPCRKVHQRWRSIRDRLKAHDRAHAVAIALALQLIGPPQRALDVLLWRSEQS